MSEDKKITIVTHSGHFHADEIFAVAVLLLVLGDEGNVKVIRSREKEVIEKGDYIIDIGGIDNAAKNRFDHHQTGGAGARPNTIPYASFGLVWKKFGEGLCGSKEVAERVDRKIIQPIDAIDCGIQFMESKVDGIFLYDVGEYFEAFWPTWMEEQVDIDNIFSNLVSIAQKLLQREIIKNHHKLAARLIAEKAYYESKDKRLIVLDKYCPVGEFLSKYPEPLFRIFPGIGGDWRLEAIRNNDNYFVNRKDLPQSWAGKKDEELERITGVVGATFCHQGIYLAGAKTKEAILKMAEIALNS